MLCYRSGGDRDGGTLLKRVDWDSLAHSDGLHMHMMYTNPSSGLQKLLKNRPYVMQLFQIGYALTVVSLKRA